MKLITIAKLCDHFPAMIHKCQPIDEARRRSTERGIKLPIKGIQRLFKKWTSVFTSLNLENIAAASSRV